jgi:hypothetical protein
MPQPKEEKKQRGSMVCNKEEEGVDGVHRQLYPVATNTRKQRRAARSAADYRLSPKGGPPKKASIAET